MQVPLFVFVLFALFCAFAQADPVAVPEADADPEADPGLAGKHGNWLICAKKAPAANQAIQRFCEKSDIVVPSNYAKTGKHGGTLGNAMARIEGNCNPPQWVPKEYCYKQFREICATGSSNGGGTKHFGRNGCQSWQIVTLQTRDGLIGNG